MPVLARWMERHEAALLRCLGLAAFLTLVFFVFSPPIVGVGDPQYLWLADSFLKGRLDLPGEVVAAIGRMDTVLRGGRFYWPLGPLPALLFAPAVAFFGPDMFIESYGHAFLAAAAFVGAFVLARRKGFGRTDAAWMAVAFTLGSVLVGILFMNGPWFFEDLLSCVLLLAALVEREGKNRPALIGTLIGLAAASRLPAVLAGCFFFLCELSNARPAAEKIRRVALMAAPLLVAICVLGVYDAARFGDPFHAGVADHFLSPDALSEGRDRFGAFSVVNVPHNAFAYFLELPVLVGGLPVVDPHGVSVALISPIFLWVLAARPKERDVWAAALCVAALLALVLTYFTTGFVQFGPRYLADVTPLVFLVLLGVFKERGFGARHKSVIAASATVNLAIFWIFALRHLYKIG